MGTGLQKAMHTAVGELRLPLSSAIIEMALKISTAVIPFIIISKTGSQPLEPWVCPAFIYPPKERGGGDKKSEERNENKQKESNNLECTMHVSSPSGRQAGKAGILEASPSSFPTLSSWFQAIANFEHPFNIHMT